MKPKIALCLPGGGVTGGMYQIGALAALEDALEGFQANDLALYVGTSSGASVANADGDSELTIQASKPGKGGSTPLGSNWTFTAFMTVATAAAISGADVRVSRSVAPRNTTSVPCLART